MKNEIIYTPPADKSITIRALVISALAEGKSIITNPLLSDDTLNTIKALKKLGVRIKIKDKKITVYGNGLYGFKKAKINVGESALLLNLLLPVVLNQKYIYEITGRKTILKRNFKETIKALTKLGANIKHHNFKLPIKTYPSSLKPKTIRTSSAQTKSTLLISGLYTGRTKIIENLITRDHTEIMLKKYGCKIKTNNKSIELIKENLKPQKIYIPGDISQASVFITLVILTNKKILIKNCGINPRRLGFINQIKKAGIKAKCLNRKIISGEATADIYIEPIPKIKGLNIKKRDLPSFIDEFILLSLILSKAKDKSVIEGVDRLKNKESNRLEETIKMLKKLGVRSEYQKDKLIIYPVKEFENPKTIDTKNDHRIAMVAGILKKIFSDMKIKKSGCVKKTYPDFFKDINKM